MPLKRILQGKRVHDGCQHAHVVGSRAVHALRGGLQSAEDVAAADDDGNLDATTDHRLQLAGERVEDVRIDAVSGFAHEGLAGQLEQDSREAVLTGQRSLPSFATRRCAGTHGR